MRQMIRVGLWLNLISILAITVVSECLAPLVLH
jgi:di/tricarboxylate transporter